jgi:hypothetical protein
MSQSGQNSDIRLLRPAGSRDMKAKARAFGSNEDS